MDPITVISSFFLKHLEKPRGDNCIKKPYFFLSFVIASEEFCVFNPSNLLFYLLYLFYQGTDTPCWLINSTMRPDEIVFIQILPFIFNAVPIYS